MLNESIFSVKNPLLPRPPPEPSEAKLSPSIIEQELSVTRRTLKADGRLFNAERRFQFGGGKLECVCVFECVCVLYVLLVFQGMWVFYIYFGVIVFFFFLFLENQRKSILKKVNFSG